MKLLFKYNTLRFFNLKIDLGTELNSLSPKKSSSKFSNLSNLYGELKSKLQSRLRLVSFLSEKMETGRFFIKLPLNSRFSRFFRFSKS